MSRIDLEEQASPSTPSANKVSLYPKADGFLYSMDDSGVEIRVTNEAALGNVVGPASATNNAVTRYDGVTGKLIQNSGVTIDDSNNMIIAGNLDVLGTTTTIDSVTLDVTDANITVNKDGNDASAEGAGLTIERVGSDGSIIYEDAAASKFKVGVIGSEVEVADISTAQTFTNKSISADQIKLATLGTPIYTESQQGTNLFNSTGVIQWDNIVDDGDGSVTVGAGSGLIRATNNTTAELNLFDWSAEAGANVNLVDNDQNYIYVEYNAGTPRLIATTILRVDTQTNIYLANVYREGTNLHVTNIDYVLVVDSAALIDQRSKELNPFAHVSGGSVGETGTRNFSVTEFSGWHGLIAFTVTAMDTSVADTFAYYYQDGIGGFTEVVTQTQINNTQFDDGSGTLATLVNNQYGVHWIYRGIDGDCYVLFGRASYTLADAQIASAPANVPPHFENHTTIYARIIIQDGTAIFTDITSAFDTTFTGTSVSNHNELSGLQGGTAAEYYHLTAAEHAALGGGGDVSGPASAIDNSIPRYDGVTGKIIQESNIIIDDLDNISGADHIGAKSIEVVHTAVFTDDHAVEIDVFADGNADVKALDIVYSTGAIALGDDEAIILVNIDESLSTGGDIAALEVLATDGIADVHAVLSGVGVGPIRQLSGTFGDMTSALVNATDRLAEFTAIGSDVQMFVADNDTVTIGNTTKFEEIEFLLAIVTSGSGIQPTFEYSTGVGLWGLFTPIDGTNGMKNNGVIAWLDSDIPTWATGLNTEYLIRITRTKNAVTTPPTESIVQIAEATEYFWNAEAKVCAKELKLGVGGIFADNIFDEDTMISDSPTALASQQSIKAYVDTATSGAGDTISSATSVDQSIARYNGTNNKTIEDSKVLIDDDGRISQTGLGTSTIIGLNAGINDDLSTNKNVAIGEEAMKTNTTQTGNVAVGYQALTLQSGINNTAIGYRSLSRTTTSSLSQNNTAVGYDSGLRVTSGYYNTFVGSTSGSTSTTAIGNSSYGYTSGARITTGTYNTDIGYQTGRTNTGDYNVNVGYKAGYGASTVDHNNNVFIGSNTAASLTSGSRNILVGDGVDLPLGTTNDHLNIGDMIVGDITAGEMISMDATGINLKTQIYPDVATLATTGTIATDCSTGNTFTTTLTGVSTLANPTNLKAGATYTWFLDIDGVGGHTLAWGTLFHFGGALRPSITNFATAKNMLVAVYDGTNLRCTLTTNVA